MNIAFNHHYTEFRQREKLEGIKNLILLVSNPNSQFYILKGRKSSLRKLLRWGVPRDRIRYKRGHAEKWKGLRAILDPSYIEEIEQMRMEMAAECLDLKSYQAIYRDGVPGSLDFALFSPELRSDEYYYRVEEGTDIKISGLDFFGNIIDFEIKDVSTFVCFFTIGHKFYHCNGGWGSEKTTLCSLAIKHLFNKKTQDSFERFLFGEFRDVVMKRIAPALASKGKPGKLITTDTFTKKYSEEKFGKNQKISNN